MRLFLAASLYVLSTFPEYKKTRLSANFASNSQGDWLLPPVCIAGFAFTPRHGPHLLYRRAVAVGLALMISDRLRPYDDTRELVVPHFLLRCPVPNMAGSN
jgi:hypothetical protein